ncbi:Phophatidylinositol-4-phosphate 5-kinase [hydrothermal vent metagenome]|uniref:Phophatidylinositol-4-phosphate 5-kinase n=1 Tax=hydrothermal vent metagenome TaxID=652676 RepID=A0A1W1CYR7_9ZZZZ
MKKHLFFLSPLLLFIFLGCESSSPNPSGEVVKVENEYFTGGGLRSKFLMTDNTKQNGTLKKYGYEGKVTSIVKIKNGVKNGMEVWYDPKGRAIKQIPYVNGVVHGTYKVLYPNGSALATTPVINGVKEGEAYSYNPDGSIHKRVVYMQGKITN